MRIVTLAGGIGGARFIRGLLHYLQAAPLPDAEGESGTATATGHQLTIIANTADDITLHGLRVCPDLDTLTYTLGDGIDETQGWGRCDETHTVAKELSAYGSGPDWFTLGDKDFATHIARTHLLGQGATLTEATQQITRRWQLTERWGTDITLLPMSDDRVETHVVIDDPDADGGQRAIHFQQWWVQQHAQVPARRITAIGIEQSQPAPGVLDAIKHADVVLLAPSNPVVSLGTILGVPGIRKALRTTTAPVVGISPIIGGAPVRGMADACLTAIGVESTAGAVAELFADFIDAWLVDDVDAPGFTAPHSAPTSYRVIGRPLFMTDRETTAAMAEAALAAARGH